jgi:hypothetical protein
MRKPEPKRGLVVRYDFLWDHEARKGQQEGTKDRPCAVIHAIKQEQNGLFSVLLAPITHTPPTEKNGIEIPHAVAKSVGLDDERQWIKTDALNRVSWDDAGITPASKKKWEYGRLPKWLSDQARADVQEKARVRKLQMVKRDVDQQEALNPSQEKTARQNRGKNRDQGKEL